jgi:hypothetical protein
MAGLGPLLCELNKARLAVESKKEISIKYLLTLLRIKLTTAESTSLSPLPPQSLLSPFSKVRAAELMQ